MAEDTRKWGDIQSLWIERANIVKMIILQKAIYRFKEITVKIPMTLLIELGKNALKFI